MYDLIKYDGGIVKFLGIRAINYWVSLVYPNKLSFICMNLPTIFNIEKNNKKQKIT